MIIDLRSDTVTKPTKPMLEAMFKAEVGDDVFGEEPTVNALEHKAANLFGMEAALFCPSGTMTNQIAINVHTRPGDEVICDATSHIYNYEGGGIASNSGVQAQLINGHEGRISPQQVSENIKPLYDWMTRTTLVSIENTGNKAGGSYYSHEQMKALSILCKEHQLMYHLDGARIFNAIVETDYLPSDLGKLFDSISICLSKGLGAPVGSLLLGNKEFIRKARRRRKVFGGGMRQAGYLAAAGIYALDHHVERLKEDHKRAKELETIVSGLDYVENVVPVYTNIVIFNLHKKIQPQAFIEKLTSRGLKASGFGKQAIRFVTHLDFTDDLLSRTKEILKSS